MNTTVDVTILQEALDLVSGYVSKHATLPILENIYMKSTIDSLVFKATDMEKHIEMTIPAQIKGEGSITINAKTFTNIIKSIEEEQVQLLVENEMLTIKSTKDKFEIKGIAASEYVALPEVHSDNQLEIDAASFITGVEKVEYTVSEKNFSPVLTGVYIRVVEINNQKFLVFVGSDSFRLAEYRLPIKTDMSDLNIIIPKMNITDIKKSLQYFVSKEGDKVTITFSDNMISFLCKTENNIEILTTSLLIQGNFPDYNNESIMPTKFNTKVLADKTALEKAVKKILIMTRDINNYVLVETKDDSMATSSGDTDKGAANTSIPAVITGDEQTIGINGKYITEYIRNISSDEIEINIVDNQKPLVFKDTSDDQYTYIARPLLK